MCCLATSGSSQCPPRWLLAPVGAKKGGSETFFFKDLGVLDEIFFGVASTAEGVMYG